jgi:hypothetical protein
MQPPWIRPPAPRSIRQHHHSLRPLSISIDGVGSSLAHAQCLTLCLAARIPSRFWTAFLTLSASQTTATFCRCRTIGVQRLQQRHQPSFSRLTGPNDKKTRPGADAQPIVSPLLFRALDGATLVCCRLWRTLIMVAVR